MKTPRLVLLPGMDGTGDLFDSIQSALIGDIETLVISYPVDQALSYSELTEYVRARLPTDGQFVLLGESFSGPIATNVAGSPPPNMVGLILCATFVRSPHATPFPVNQTLLQIGLKLSRGFFVWKMLLGNFHSRALQQQIQAAVDKVSTSVLAARVIDMTSVDASAGLRATTMPILYLRASSDWLVPSSASTYIAKTNPTVQMVDVVGPHFLLQSKPVECAERIIEFCKGLRCAS
ncbi:MAG: alpha/beta fold hydrolase [Rhodocyclaceae bacterium]|nr:alpha/beta fold hydrolase [Rhodocyclaceae bacterium]MCA3029492.1 alpha/beta fold hydrolase [Rhodocyclaceae bacterium]MCA3033439.1 alpha/beta fold hydrolase [Rhodocyclaceae bacterium]MCA3038322.1 alpha/beta fold hydrolase [Rhodocyclaceae bacterium]MCA3061771.1 alpha/beta fold hydrolase [Rhodocyclaceae bacterium]